MKITVLEGSPHKNGSSNLLAKQFIKGAKEAGHFVTVLEAAHMDVHPCIGCEHCGMNGECVHNDDNRLIRDTLLGSDMVVFVTPIYYFGMSAQLKIAMGAWAWGDIDGYFGNTMAGMYDNSVEKMCEASLSRMHMEYFDIYWIHNPVGAPEYTKQLIPLLHGKVQA